MSWKEMCFFIGDMNVFVKDGEYFLIEGKKAEVIHITIMKTIVRLNWKEKDELFSTFS